MAVWFAFVFLSVACSAQEFSLRGREQTGERLQRQFFQEFPDFVLLWQFAALEESLHICQAAVTGGGFLQGKCKEQILQTRIAAGIGNNTGQSFFQRPAILCRQLGNKPGDFGNAQLGPRLLSGFPVVHAVQRHVEQMFIIGQVFAVMGAGELKAAGKEEV